MECHHDLSIHKRLVEFWQGHNIQALANKWSINRNRTNFDDHSSISWMWCDCQQSGLEATLQSLCDMHEMKNTMYITYNTGLCAKIRWPCPWKTKLDLTDMVETCPRFIISGALWFKVLSTVDSISGSGIMFSLCSIRWAILQIFKHCPYFDGQCSVPGSHWCLNHWLFPDHLESSINSDSGLMAWLLNHIYVCFLYTIIIFVGGPQVRVYWGDLNHLEVIENGSDLVLP